VRAHFKFRHVNELVGVFVLGVVALIVIGIIFSGHSQRWFARKFAFDVLLPQAGTSGLRRGDEVFILGVSAGLVDDVIVKENGRVKAHVKMRRDFERFVRSDSTAEIKKAFAVAGDSFMEISAGTGPPLSAENPTINCAPSEDSLGRIEKIVNDLHAELIPVVKKAGVALEKWTTLGEDLQQTRKELNGLLARWDRLSEGLEQGKGTAGRLLTDSALAGDAQQLLTGARQAMSQFQLMATNLNAAVTNIQAGAARLPQIADAVATETKDLPGLVHQTQVSMVELERLIEALQRHWLVRRYIKKNDPVPLSSNAREEEAPSKTSTVRNSSKFPRNAPTQ
jgi:phospholipid/cholesterol/gamma-HCH transport system substrate-binding protein